MLAVLVMSASLDSTTNSKCNVGNGHKREHCQRLKPGVVGSALQKLPHRIFRQPHGVDNVRIPISLKVIK